MLRLGSFLIWLWLFKDLKIVPLVDDRAIFVNFWWLKYPFSSIKAWLSASVGLIVADRSFLWGLCFSSYKWKHLLSNQRRHSLLYYKYSPSPFVLLRIVHMIPGLSVCGLVIYTSRMLWWAVCWMLRQVRSKTLWKRSLKSWPSGSFEWKLFFSFAP